MKSFDDLIKGIDSGAESIEDSGTDSKDSKYIETALGNIKELINGMALESGKDGEFDLSNFREIGSPYADNLEKYVTKHVDTPIDIEVEITKLGKNGIDKLLKDIHDNEDIPDHKLVGHKDGVLMGLISHDTEGVGDDAGYTEKPPRVKFKSEQLGDLSAYMDRNPNPVGSQFN